MKRQFSNQKSALSGESGWKKTDNASCSRKILISLLLGVLLFTAFNLFFGSVTIPFDQLFSGNLSSNQAAILMHLRLPRTIACIFGGAALALSGLIIQSVLANSLAAPNIIGIHSGAGLLTALACALFPEVFNLVPIAAFAGALGASLFVMILARRISASRSTLLLAGLAISSIFSALTDLVITFWPDALIGYSGFRMGSLSGVGFAKMLPGLMAIIPALIFSLLCAPELEILSSGSDSARLLGLNSARWSLLFLILSSLLAGGTISFGGLIGFIGLIVPQIIRRIFKAGCSYRTLMLADMLAGSLLLLACDLAGRILFAPYEISCGILLSLAGGPYFLYLLLRNRKRNPFSRRSPGRKKAAEAKGGSPE